MAKRTKSNAKKAKKKRAQTIQSRSRRSEKAARAPTKGDTEQAKQQKADEKARHQEEAEPLRQGARDESRQAAKPRYYLTTAIAYPNGVPHIGHAYEAIATDAIARFMRLDGYDVYFLTGTDEHGIKMLQTAAREGITPHELVERNVPRFQAMVERLNCSNDDFIRTTEERHHRSSQAIWDRMEKNGDIYLSKYSGWYSVRDEAYYDEDETRIDEGGVRLGPQGTPVEWVEEESYFFKLSAYQDRLLDLYARVPDFVLPKERFNEVASFVKRGLQDLSISRTTFEWGIPVPGQRQGANAQHIMYVWVDALTNYITALGFPDTKAEKFLRYWPADLHVIGKDIVRFHAVYWPAFLMSADIEVPRRIFSHGFLFNRGEKMSKSVGNVVDPFALVDAYGVDQLRYFLLREVPFGQDGNYSHEAIVNRINADLANDLGNLAQRSLSMIGKQLGGVLPKPGAFSDSDKTILSSADAMIGKAREAMKTQQLHQVLNAAWSVVADANRYFAGEAPWALAKTDPARQGTVLYVTAEVIRQVAILAQPFIPMSAAKLLDLLAIPADQRSFAALGAHRLAPGSTLPAPSAVFPRYIESKESAPGLETKESVSAPGMENKKNTQVPQEKLAPFVEKLDLELAFRRTKADLQSERYFVHSPLEIELVEVERNDWLNRLRTKIAEGYRPHSALMADIPKGNGAVRPGALLTLEDRVVYAAAVGAILPAINAGLRWSQGKVDFAYRLTETPRRVEWFTNTFNSWTAFRNASIERIEKGATYVVLTDITGFYENIDLTTLFSDLRSLGADPDVVRLLELCLNRWSVIPGRGVPQGLSPSDVLAKVYLNAIDRAFSDIGIDYIRYVDDIRIFCREVPASKKALMFLSQILRRRGLNLQSAKTEIVSAADAKRTIEGIAPIISEVVERYREFVEEMGSIDPYMSISQIEENIKPDDAPVEVVQEAFRLNFVDKTKSFNKTLFHFLLNRLGTQRDGYALEYCLGQLAENPQETQTVLQYARRVGELDKTFAAIELFLNSTDCIYDYQTYQIFRWLDSASVSPSAGIVTIARQITFDNARPSYLRAVCRIVLQNHGTTADLDRLEASYGTMHDDLEKAQILVSLKGLELNRRNAFYRRVEGDGELCERAIKFVRRQKPKFG